VESEEKADVVRAGRVRGDRSIRKKNWEEAGKGGGRSGRKQELGGGQEWE
jgi:hypothetical protein